MRSDGGDPQRLLHRAEFLFLAGRDFWDVGIGIDYLSEDPHSGALPPRVPIIFETGLLMHYCRPFSGSRSQQISPDPGLSDEQRAFHDDLMTRRNKVYAHPDHTDYRSVIDFRSETGLEVLRDFENAVVREEFDTLTLTGLAMLRVLATIHHRMVSAELDRIRARLCRADEGEPVDTGSPTPPA